MTENPTEQEIKEFWEWCGWRQLPEGSRGFHHERGEKVMNWLPPDNNDYVYGQTYLPRIDLNNLFRWAVPKANSLGWGVGLMPCGNVRDPLWYGDTFNIGKELHYRETNPKMDDPAQALFRAIQQVKER